MIANLGQINRHHDIVSHNASVRAGFGTVSESAATFEISLAPHPVAHIIGLPEPLVDRIARALEAGHIQTCRHIHFRAYAVHERPEAVGCVLVRAAAISSHAFDALAAHVRTDAVFPWIVAAEEADLHTAVRAMKAGAVEVLTAPFDDGAIVEAIENAIELAGARRTRAADLARTVRRFETLTHREREIMANVVAGLMNKQIAGNLGISEITVKMHRGSVMRKMAARTLVDLVRMADAVGLEDMV